MWRAACLCGLLGTALAAGPTKNIQGRTVTMLGPVIAESLVDVGPLRFFRATFKDTGSECTVIRGAVTSRAGNADFTIELDVRMVITRPAAFKEIAVAKMIIERPVPDRPVPFEMIALPFFPEQNRDGWVKDGWKPQYLISARLVPFVAAR